MKKICVKTGDSGETSIRGKRRSKGDPLLEAVGTLDELSCFLGLARAEAKTKKDRRRLLAIQKDIWALNAVLAGRRNSFPLERIRFLEEKTAFWRNKSPRRKSFVFPGKTSFEAHLHVCRAVCRRAERQTVKLKQPPSAVLKYLNRLSGFLFAMAVGS